jgi:hypothetical protein
MKTTLRLHYYDKSEADLQKLNELLNDFGITFTPDHEDHTNKDGKKTTQKLLHIEVREDILCQYKKRKNSNAGRPTVQIDYDKIVELKRKGLDVNGICKELKISRALYYREVITSIDRLASGTRIEYRPIDEDQWYTGTIQINGRGGKYIQGDDGIADYPRKNDVIRKL